MGVEQGQGTTALVADVMKEVLARVPPAQLSVRLEAAGYPKTGGRYSTSNIYGWAEGKTTPPSDVFVAAIQIAEISLDDYLYGDAATDRKERQRLAALERERDEEKVARAKLIDEVARLAKAFQEGATKMERQEREKPTS